MNITYPNNSHNHPEPCAHAEFYYCIKCDVVQCGKCKKEWSIPKQQSTYFQQGNNMLC